MGLSGTPGGPFSCRGRRPTAIDLDCVPVITGEELEERLAAVRGAIERAADRAGRDPDRVEVLPVTKGHPVELLRAVADAGLPAVGENRVPEARAKQLVLGSRLGLRWHLIGHLQRNKAGPAIDGFDVIESVASTRLANRLSKVAQERERIVEVLVQVNVSGEDAKSGVRPDDAVASVREMCALPRLRLTGVMTMAPFTSDEATLRATFAGARRLMERCADEVEGFEPFHLSMGMSNDFAIAVEEGATRLRLGTTLFGERPTP